ncbi:hypothetical protein OE88DRAFT_1713906 [Heliocybe sulcata]|uniref:Glycoside hydrolase 131 catalytic N-terminal domain-containing protein n=1 Tax=Heliocybe sulcata TaxID=5364 RepID=A0A5C3MTI7_9AGAM|nr:hypothetical protein OE88DRAFT_1713906 [Heliocybe sulcata]
MKSILSVVALISCVALTSAIPLLYDGRAPLNLTEADLDGSVGPYLTVVKGATENASHYSSLLGFSVPPTPLWDTASLVPNEQAISITIDNTSVFVPGSGGPQYGFRRTEFIAQANGNHTALNEVLDVGRTVFHFSIMRNDLLPLNYDHEYQIVFIEPSDGSHIFGIQLGSPFTDPTGTLPVPNAHSLKVLDHALNVIYTAPFTPLTWHNFAVQVDWANRTLCALYSPNAGPLGQVTEVVPNLSAPAGAAGVGDYHFGVLKLPLANPNDSPAEQADVVHYGIQEGTLEGLIYSGVFVEEASGGISIGDGLISSTICNSA